MQSDSATQISTLLRISTVLVKVAIILNLLCVILFAGMLIFSFSGEALIVEGLSRDYGPGAGEALVPAVRFAMIFGLLITGPVHVIFTRLRDMIATIQSKQIFTHANIKRLRTIGWALLVTQILDGGFGWLAWKVEVASGQMFAWTPSVTAWFCVLLIFILAHVFQQGVDMQDELEGTI